MIEPEQERLDLAVKRVKPWLRAASIYNVAWGTAVFVAPVDVGWKATAIVLLAYAIGYRYAARDPLRDTHLIVVALIGKTLGPLGFCLGVAVGAAPLSLGLLILGNDLIWCPSFFRFVRAVARAEGGWRPLLG